MRPMDSRPSSRRIAICTAIAAVTAVPVLWTSAAAGDPTDGDPAASTVGTGPRTSVEVYDDFYTYGSGVYSHVMGPFTGLHCVAVVGYDDGNRSWLCKNSWGAGWGEQGFFRIRYGQCEIDKGFPFWGIAGTRWFL